MSTAQETLEQCSLKLQRLSGSIDRIRSLSISNNTIDLIAPPSTPTSPVMSGRRAAARCHECHGPIAGYHQGYPHGLGLCQLQHYDRCPGGVTEKDRGGHTWKICPPEYLPPQLDEEISDDDDSLYVNEDLISNSTDGENAGAGQAASRASEGFKNPNTSAPTNMKPEGKSEIDLLLESELADLAFAEAEEKKLKEVAEIRKRKEQSLENIARLTRQAQGEGARTKTSIQSSIDILRSSNRAQSVPRKDASSYSGPTMPDIRQDSFTRNNVETLMDTVYEVPAFSNASQHRSGQPHLKPTHQTRVCPTPNENRLGGRVMDKIQIVTQKPTGGEKLFKWVFKRDQYGRDFKELVEASPERPPSPPRHIVDTSPGWYFDEQTNRMYKNPTHSHPTTHPYHDSRREGHTPDQQQQRVVVDRTPAGMRSVTAKYERVPGIVPLTSNQSEEREGKLPLSIASHARNLPMEYARSATSKNMNFAVFMYGAIHELHSSRIGITPAMQKGVLEAKLQHLLNVIHVTCLNATAADFKPVAWSVGRTYHSLVQGKVDSGREDWTDFDMLHRGSPHAAEMVAAEREHRAALLAKPDKSTINVKKVDKKEDKPPCTTWNEYEEEGKCKYEADHPGEKCNRSHHCSYCKKKNPSFRTLHQARYCKKRLEEDK